MSGEKLKEIIVKKGFTLAEVARRIGVSAQSISQSLGSNDLKSGYIEKISRVLQIPIAAMYGEITASVDNADLTFAKQAIFELTLENTRLKKRVEELEMKKGEGDLAS